MKAVQGRSRGAQQLRLCRMPRMAKKDETMTPFPKGGISGRRLRRRAVEGIKRRKRRKEPSKYCTLHCPHQQSTAQLIHFFLSSQFSGLRPQVSVLTLLISLGSRVQALYLYPPTSDKGEALARRTGLRQRLKVHAFFAVACVRKCCGFQLPLPAWPH